MIINTLIIVVIMMIVNTRITHNNHDDKTRDDETRNTNVNIKHNATIDTYIGPRSSEHRIGKLKLS